MVAAVAERVWAEVGIGTRPEMRDMDGTGKEGTIDHMEEAAEIAIGIVAEAEAEIEGDDIIDYFVDCRY